MADIIDFVQYKKEKNENKYETHLRGLHRLELMQEMQNFQHEVMANGGLDIDMALKGHTLFRVLEETALTPELKEVAATYKKDLESILAEVGVKP